MNPSPSQVGGFFSSVYTSFTSEASRASFFRFFRRGTPFSREPDRGRPKKTANKRAKRAKKTGLSQKDRAPSGVEARILARSNQELCLLNL